MEDQKNMAQISAMACRVEQRIDVGIALPQRGWGHRFTICLKGGSLPEMYRGDPEIVAAYERCLAHREKWKSKEAADQVHTDVAKKDAEILDRAETLIAISKNVGYPLSADSSNPALDAAICQVEGELAVSSPSSVKW